MAAYAHLGYAPGDFPVTERMAQEIFSLPMYPALTDTEQDEVCAAVTEILDATE